MEPKKYFAEDKPIVSVKRARELMPGTQLNDEELQNVLLSIQQFAEMSYELYLEKKKIPENDPDESYAMAA